MALSALSSKKSGGAYLPKASPLKATSSEAFYSNPPLGVKKKRVPVIMGGKPVEHPIDYSAPQFPISGKWLYVDLEYPERFPS